MTANRTPTRAERLRLPPKSERYSFQVADKSFAIQYLHLTYLEGYDDAQLTRLAASRVFEVSFYLKDYAKPDGTIVSGYGEMGTGHAFQVLGGVANGVLDWAEKNRPDYLFWYAQGTRRRRLYDRMIQCFCERGSGMHRLRKDPFTGLPSAPEVFWLAHSTLSLSPPVPDERP